MCRAEDNSTGWLVFSLWSPKPYMPFRILLLPTFVGDYDDLGKIGVESYNYLDNTAPM
jgi:hypothetical protein